MIRIAEEGLQSLAESLKNDIVETALGISRLLVPENRANKVTVTHRYENERILHLDISCHPEDRGKLIGRQGETAELLRRIFHNIAKCKNTTIFIHITD